MTKSMVMVFLMFVVHAACYAQAEKLERRHAQLMHSMLEARNTLDSLNHRLLLQAHEVENEKKRPIPNRQRLEGLLAKSIGLSNLVKDQQRTVSAIREELKLVRVELERGYEHEIELLKKSGAEESRLLHLTEKKLLLASELQSLTHDPIRVREIDLAKTTDDFDRAVKRDYLINAHAEATTVLNDLRKAREETEQVLRLRSKMKDFLEDAGEQNSFNVFSSARTETGIPGSGIVFDRTAMAYAASVVSVMQQLQVGSLSPAKWSSGPVSGSEYVALLKNAENTVDAYRKMIAKKLE